MTNTEKKESVAAARSLLRACDKAALGTLMLDGSPLVTLVALATSTEGTPLLLLSQLAAHTQNIAHDPRASLLLEKGTASGGPTGDPTSDPTSDPMTAARLSLSGCVVRLDDKGVRDAKQCFTARHPAAAPYDLELDFHYYAFQIESARFNQGFGRFRKLRAQDLLDPRLGPRFGEEP